ncbi:hypothetical protein ASA1KI_41300 [Opitutales bacterium ASA1]|nr:hypothetical protein ASA1KI_41300 [Opitutales bacterium ASA1]
MGCVRRGCAILDSFHRSGAEFDRPLGTAEDFVDDEPLGEERDGAAGIVVRRFLVVGLAAAVIDVRDAVNPRMQSRADGECGEEEDEHRTGRSDHPRG